MEGKELYRGFPKFLDLGLDSMQKVVIGHLGGGRALDVL